MFRNRYSPFPHPAQDTKGEKNKNTWGGIRSEAENQVGSCLPGYSNNANKISKTTEAGEQ